MMGTYILGCSMISMLLAVASCVLYVLGRKNEKRRTMAWYASAGALVFLTAAILIRTALLKRFPLTSGADFLQIFCWMILAIHLFLSRKGNGVGEYATLIAVLLQLVLWLLMRDQLTQAQPLPLALTSPLLGLHVFTAALAYSLFAVAAAAAALMLRKKGEVKKEWIVRLVKLGFASLTVTIVLGSVWAEEAWGSYWSWDPKETWALITWIIYAILLHRYKVYSDRKTCVFVIVGFAASIFTFLGVSYLLPGLHSYALS